MLKRFLKPYPDFLLLSVEEYNCLEFGLANKKSNLGTSEEIRLSAYTNDFEGELSFEIDF